MLLLIVFTSLALYLLDKGTIGKYNFVFVILNVMLALVLDSTQSFVQLNSRGILQLINSISKRLQKLLKYFSGTSDFYTFKYSSLTFSNQFFFQQT